MILPIAKLPSQVLRRPTEPLDFPLKRDYSRLLKNMLDTVKSAEGVGLAAPQVGQSLKLALIYIPDAGIPPLPIINPVITETSKETIELEEGCLSMPGVFGLVKRPKKITMTGYNQSGKQFTITDDTFLARVIQHEIDHLNNILIIDKFIKINQGQDLLANFRET